MIINDLDCTQMYTGAKLESIASVVPLTLELAEFHFCIALHRYLSVLALHLSKVAHEASSRYAYNQICLFGR